MSSSWFERGIESIRLEEWFDSLQLLKGALQRAVMSNHPEIAEKVFIEAIPLYKKGNKENIACNLVVYYVRVLEQERLKEIKWIRLIGRIIEILHENTFQDCVKRFTNNIIVEKKFLEDNILNLFTEIVHSDSIAIETKKFLFYCIAGLYSAKKDYVACFTILNDLTGEVGINPVLGAYLTLAEINAYELEGCGKYLKGMDGELNQIEETYLEIAQRVFQSVESLNINEYRSIQKEYSDIINYKSDALLKSLFEGIGEIFQSSHGSNIFSSFFKA